jgi:hypothetical protein
MMARSALLAVCFFLVSFGDTVFQEPPTALRTPLPEFGTAPPDCQHLYNNGSHEAWAECMGVGY